MHIEPGLYPSIVYIVVAMISKVRERLGAQAFEYNGISVSVHKITQKVAVHLNENQSVFITQNSDLSQIFGCDLEHYRGYNETKRSSLSSVFLRHYKKTFIDDIYILIL